MLKRRPRLDALSPRVRCASGQRMLRRETMRTRRSGGRCEPRVAPVREPPRSSRLRKSQVHCMIHPIHNRNPPLTRETAVKASAGENRPLSRRKGTRASVARSQGHAGGDAGTGGRNRSIPFCDDPLRGSGFGNGQSPPLNPQFTQQPSKRPKPKTQHPSLKSHPSHFNSQ